MLYFVKVVFQHALFLQGYGMPRHLNLRQIEAFKAVIENGTVSRARRDAEHLAARHEQADRSSRRRYRPEAVRPAEGPPRADRARHAASMRRSTGSSRASARSRMPSTRFAARSKGGSPIGVMPALSGSFIQRATTGFLKDRPTCSARCIRAVRNGSSIGWSRADSTSAWSAPRIDNPYIVTLSR